MSMFNCCLAELWGRERTGSLWEGVWESKVRSCSGGLNMWPSKQEEGAAGMSQRFVWGRLPQKRVAVMSCCVRSLCQYETNKLVRIQSVRLGSMKWSLNGFILLFIWWVKVPQMRITHICGGNADLSRWAAHKSPTQIDRKHARTRLSVFTPYLGEFWFWCTGSPDLNSGYLIQC